MFHWFVCLVQRSSLAAVDTDVEALPTTTIEVKADSYANMVAAVRQDYPREVWDIDDFRHYAA